MKNEKSKIAIKKAYSLLAKILQMIEGDKYCIDIIQQNLAVIGLLKSANLEMLDNHLHHCVKNAIDKKDEKTVDKMMEELLRVIQIAQNK